MQLQFFFLFAAMLGTTPEPSNKKIPDVLLSIVSLLDGFRVKLRTLQMFNFSSLM